MYGADFKTFRYPTRIESSGITPSLPDVEFVRAIQKRNQQIFYLSLTATGMI
jgi:hypothetical protein